MRYVSLVSAVLATGLLLAPAPAEASEPKAPRIAGGVDAETCAFPTAALFGGGTCSATLVHPEVVVYAAHCGSGGGVQLGESYGSGQNLSVEFCRTNPSYAGVSDQAHDWAFCKLSQPVTNLPLAPILFGCETDLLVPGAEVYMVGFGEPGYGRKTYAQTYINSVTEGMVDMGGNGQTACPGDSGGPAFIQVGDGTWRAFGIASTMTGGCGPGTNQHSRMDGAVGWIESESGVDVTPCFEPDGTWVPGPDCGQFIASGPEGHGSWGSWCDGTPVGGPSATCGPPYNSEPDDDPPYVVITTPSDGDYFEFTGDLVDVPIEVEADDGEGWGVKAVTLQINGQDLGVESTIPPHSFDTRFPEGLHEIVASAEDHAGNVGESDTVRIGVGVEVPPPDPTDTGDDGDSGDDGSDDGGSDDGGTGGPGPDMWPESDDERDGCGCRSRPASPGGLPLAFLLIALAPLATPRRRRRR
jgi:hypothetical protein